MDRRETERLLDVIRQARALGEPSALATIVRVRGSAYRREGTRMFVRADGTYVCSLSGGCLEPTVAEAAARVIATGEPAIVGYDLADDSIWGLGIGCSGAVDIRIERLGDDPLVNEWLGILDRGEAAVLVTALAGVTGRMIVREHGAALGRLSDEDVAREVVGRARSRLGAAYPASAAESIGSCEVFVELATTPPELVVFGAGEDAVPLVQLAWSLGFVVTVVDVREALLVADRFPGARLVHAHFSQFAEKVPIGPRSFVVVMNHHIERDQASLRHGLESDVPYIGVLGPRTRYEKLLKGLAGEGYVPDPARAGCVRSPVGLALGAETSQEVAVSVLGEILAIRRGFDGGFLSGSHGSLHRPDESRVLARS
jgi:xanthine dehydrogenase accessory factor